MPPNPSLTRLSSQIQAPVPRQKQLPVRLEPSHLLVGEVCPLSNLLSKGQRERCISSKDTAAGVTPGIRLAWPSVAGCTRASFS